MSKETARAAQYCLHMSELTGAACTLLRIEGEKPTIVKNSCACCCDCSRSCELANMLYYGCSEAYRWDGQYVFYCTEGLIFIAASLTDDQGALDGGMILGPIIMGELSDTMLQLSGYAAESYIRSLPQWDAGRVHHAGEVLRAVTLGMSGTIQNRYGQYLYNQEQLMSKLYSMQHQLGKSNDPEILIRNEKRLSQLIADRDKEGAQALFNEMLANIFFSGNADFFTLKARLIEMLVTLSRASIDAGAGIQEILLFNEGSLRQLETISTIEDLNAWMTIVLHRFIQYSFDFSQVKHTDTLHKIVQYLKDNYDRKITLDDVAAHVYLSRSYVSSIFKKEMGEGIFPYLNRIRVEKSKVLLLNDRVSLADVGGLCGFSDQSYFTKIFRNQVGMTPKRFRECRGKPEKHGK